MKVIVIVPFRPDGGHRDRLWHYLRDSYWPQFRFPIVLGHHDDGPFNRSAAINGAATQRDWQVAVIADSDTWVPPAQLRAAVKAAHDFGRMCSALTGVVELDQRCTDSILDRTLSWSDIGIAAVRTGDLATQSSMLAVPRRLWDDVGGFDAKFVGWGGEDNAFWRACAIVGGAEPRRIPGYAYHLWHEPAVTTADKRTDPAYLANLARWNRYRVSRHIRQLRAAQNAP